MEKIGTRLRVLALLVLLMFAALTTRLWFLQVLATTDFTSQARDNSVRFVRTDALRGEIEDANGTEIVTNQLSIEVRVSMDELAASGREEQVIYRLANLLNREPEEITARLESNKYLPYQPKPIAEFVRPAVEAYIKDYPRMFPGVDVVHASVRDYPQGRLAANILGSLGLINGEELGSPRFRAYGINDMVGRGGLEQVYERWLHGTKGEQKFIVNADGEVLRALGSAPSTPGHDIRLELDIETQRIAEEELRLGMERARQLTDSDGYLLKANAGVVVILDPQDGGVEAMASVPSFDPRWQVQGTTPRQERYLANDVKYPQVNRAVQGEFFPGSTFKVVSGLSAIKAGFATLSGYYPCTTTYQHADDETSEFTNWKPSNRSITFAQALVESCDTWFYRFGSQFYFHWLNNQLSKDGELMQKLFREWGFGRPTGIDLTGEYDGLVADADWAADNPGVFFGNVWQPGGNILSMIGSDYLMATPLQLARGYMAIANRGHLCRPHLVDEILRPGTNKVVREIPGQCDQRIPGYTESQLAYVHEALLGVTASGTAACAFGGFPLDSIPVAGKTGTAEVPDQLETPWKEQDTSWFAAIVGPKEDPDHVVVVMVEKGGFGSQTAAPIVRRIVERMYHLSPNPLGCGTAEQD